jgi:hypothetical protein
MKYFLLKILVVVSLLSFSTFGQNDSVTNPKAELVPILVLFEFGVWTEVPGTDMPDFVLYDDGTVIYNAAKEAGAYNYVTAKLSADEIDQVMEKINASGFESYKDHYSIGEKYAVSDLPSPFIMFKRNDGTYKTVSTYGFLGEKADEEFRVKEIPKALVDAFYFLWKYETPKAAPWRSDFIEAIVWKYDGKSKKNVKWDKKLPDLGGSKTAPFKIWDEQYYSLFVPESSELIFGRIYWKIRRSKRALLMNGQRWNLTFRFPFPAERIWLAGKAGEMFRDEK